MQLRDYQENLIADVRASIRDGHKNVLAVLPTGGGKTVVAGSISANTSAKGLGCFFICHRDFLVHQTAITFDEWGLDYGIIAAGHKMQDRAIQICSIDTLKNRLDKVDTPGVRIWDEAHHLRAAGWMKVHAAGNGLDIGLTATPERLDGKGLNPPFTAMVIGPTTAELMAWGMLSGYRAYAPSTPDLTGVRTVAGEYSAADIERAVRESVIMGDVVGTYQQRASGRRAVYFTPDVAYSKELAAAFNHAGVRALHVDGDTPTKDRVAAAVSFADGHLDVLTNCALFGEGYDLAAQAQRDVTIDCVGLVRPTQSLTLHRQQIGRGLRPKPYPCVILDHAGNIAEHGLPDDHIEWSLGGRTKKLEAGPKQCPKCSAINKPHARYCTAVEDDGKVCNYPLTESRNQRRGPEHIDGEIQEVDVEAHRERRRQRLAEEHACQTKEDYIELGRARGYKPSWAFIRWAKEKDRIENQARYYLRDYNG